MCVWCAVCGVCAGGGGNFARAFARGVSKCDDAFGDSDTAAVDATHTESDPMMVDEEIDYDADEEVVVETVNEDDSSMELSDQGGNNYFSSEDMNKPCIEIEPKNQYQSCSRLLMTLVNNECGPSKRLSYRLEGLTKGAEAIRICPHVITPNNAHLLGQPNSPLPLKLQGIAMGIAGRLSSYVTLGFLPPPEGVGTERYVFNPPCTPWQVYYNYCGPSRESMFDSVKKRTSDMSPLSLQLIRTSKPFQFRLKRCLISLLRMEKLLACWNKLQMVIVSKSVIFLNAC